MAQRTRVHDGASATESKFYLPAGSTSSLLAGWVESIWTTLFNHGVDGSRRP
jgi:hypothetical protein